MPSFCAIYDTLFEPLLTEQLNLLLKIAKERTPVYTSIIYAAAHTGMRKSELIGLT